MAFVPLNRLRPGEEAGINARLRPHTAEDIAAMATSIKLKGVLQPLGVAPFEGDDAPVFVVFGGRRLRALWLLRDEEYLTDQFQVEVSIRTETEHADLLETSLVENIERVNMHPVDAYRAFAGLRASGLSEKKIAQRHGLKPKEVKQYLALGALAEPILEAWSDGKISEAQAQAFTLAPSKEEQLRVFEPIKSGGHMPDWQIKTALVGDGKNLSAEIALVGGLAKAKAAGVSIVEDLFETSQYVANPEVLQGLVDAEFAKVADACLADGWKWATRQQDLPTDRYRWRRIKPDAKWEGDEEARWLALIAAGSGLKQYSTEWYVNKAERDAVLYPALYRSFTAEDKAKAGVMLTLDRQANGGARIATEYGVVKREDDDEQADQAGADSAAEAKAADPFEPKSAEPRAVVDSLREVKTRGLAQAIGLSSNRDVLNILVAALAFDGDGSPVHLRRSGHSAAALFEPPRVVKTFAEALAWAKDQPDFAINEIISSLVASAVDATTPALYRWNSGNHKGVYHAGVAALVDFLEPAILVGQMRVVFDAFAYFNAAKKADALRAIEEALGAAAAKPLASKKAAEVAAFALANVPDTGWLPVELRTPGYANPIPTKEQADGASTAS